MESRFWRNLLHTRFEWAPLLDTGRVEKYGLRKGFPCSQIYPAHLIDSWFLWFCFLHSSPPPIFVTLKVRVSFYHKMGMDREVENPRDPAGMVMEGTTARNPGRSWSLGPWEQKGKFEPDCGGSQNPERVPQLTPKGKVGSLEGMPKPPPPRAGPDFSGSAHSPRAT